MELYIGAVQGIQKIRVGDGVQPWWINMGIILVDEIDMDIAILPVQSIPLEEEAFLHIHPTQIK